MAEMQTLPHAYSLTLTYADVDGQPPLGARVFRYRDVAAMWKRIRSAGARKWGEIELRYVIVGEKGTRNGRCHYHGIIFSDYPIHELGELSSPYGPGITYSTGRRKVRHDWSIWGHGFVDFQRPDRDGMAYALKYILKGRMTSARSEGHRRYGKTEWLASSTLWSSKGRSIGEKWLFSKLINDLKQERVPHSLLVRVPDGGDWYVSGPLQMKMCLFLHDQAKERAKAGLPPFAGWQSLVASVSKDVILTNGAKVKRKAWEWLNYGDPQQFIEQQSQSRKQTDEPRRLFNPYKGWITKSLPTVFIRDEYFERYGACFGVRGCPQCQSAQAPAERANDQTVENLWRDAHKNAIEQGHDWETYFDRWVTNQGLVAQCCIKNRIAGGRILEYAHARRKQADAIRAKMQRETR